MKYLLFGTIFSYFDQVIILHVTKSLFNNIHNGHKTNISFNFICTRIEERGERKRVGGEGWKCSFKGRLCSIHSYKKRTDRNLIRFFFHLPFIHSKFHFLNTSSFIFLGNVADKIAYTTRVTPFVIVPSDELDEVLVQLDSSIGIKDGRSSVTDEIGRNDAVLSVLEDALVFAFRGLLDGIFDFLVGSSFLKANDKIDDGNIKSGNTEWETAVRR